MKEVLVNNKNFDEVVHSNEFVIIDFFATWCMPCRMLAGVLEEIAEDKNVVIGKVDCDVEQALAMNFRIDSIPHIFIYKNGNLVKDILGYVEKETILEYLK